GSPDLSRFDLLTPRCERFELPVNAGDFSNEPLDLGTAAFALGLGGLHEAYHGRRSPLGAGDGLVVRRAEDEIGVLACELGHIGQVRRRRDRLELLGERDLAGERRGRRNLDDLAPLARARLLLTFETDTDDLQGV